MEDLVKKQKQKIRQLQKDLDEGFKFDLIQDPGNRVTKKISKRRQ